MTGDFLFGAALGFFATCALLFIAGWLRQSAREVLDASSFDADAEIYGAYDAKSPAPSRLVR